MTVLAVPSLMLSPSIALLTVAPLLTMAWMNEEVANGLKAVVSKETEVVDGASGIPRWSEYGAPRPGTIVDVACEDDVLKTVGLALSILRQLLTVAGSILRCKQRQLPRTKWWQWLDQGILHR